MTRQVRLIPLGGLGEIGKNLMVVETHSDTIAIDCGLSFPEDDMPGIDLVIPDVSYLVERKDRLRGIVLTHGHEDHVGALPFVLKDVNVPVYGTRLTLGLARRKLDENYEGEVDFRVFEPGNIIDFGSIQVEPFRVTHSVSDSVGLILRTPAGTIIHTGDFKLDQTPVDGEPTDYSRLARAGDEGVLALLSDSTHADRPGFTPSERVVGESLDRVFQKSRGRIIITTFASNVPRIQQVIDVAYQHNRKVCVIGRSMEMVVEVALNMGYLRAPMGTLVDASDLGRYPHSKMVILTTGSQGEPLSALARMSCRDHRKVEIIEGDLVIMAASPVPGNETMVSRVVDNLFRCGADVVYEPESEVHVSGHSSQEELKMMLNLTRPRYFVPIHGEYRHLIKHAQLAVATGVPPSNVLIGENGTIFSLSPEHCEIIGVVQTKNIMVDSSGVGEIGDPVLKERKYLSDSGAIFVSCVVSSTTGALLEMPSVKSTGFMKSARGETLLAEAAKRVKEYFDSLPAEGLSRREALEEDISSMVQKFMRNETGRRPVVVSTLCIV
ncbi:MAG: ribonuclease J [Bacillota bacterium]|jgi:ribonuclease J|nr:ribonuclease J [Candidatus Fermentithermobacillaceae bacterium]